MSTIRYHLFETVIGWAGLAWNHKGLVGAHLPDADPETARRSFLRKHPEAIEAEPPAALAPGIDNIRALMRGEKADLTFVELDESRAPDFNLKVYAIARAIPPGETLTYGEVAERLGDRLLARDVGAALGQNPWPIVVPCHRVTAAGGKLGGFSARGGTQTKARLLAVEGAAVVHIEPVKQPDLFG